MDCVLRACSRSSLQGELIMRTGFAVVVNFFPGVLLSVLLFLMLQVPVHGGTVRPHGKVVSKWVQIDRAYIRQDMGYVHAASEDHDFQIAHYARSLFESMNMRFDSAIVEAKKCIRKKASRADGYFMHLACTIAVSREYGYQGDFKNYYVYFDRAQGYARQFKSKIASVFDVRDLDKFMSEYQVHMSDARRWPSTYAKVDHDWSVIPLEHGLVKVNVAGVYVPMLVDTGSTGINLSHRDMERYGLSSRLKSLGIETQVGGYGGAAKGGGVYLAKKLSLGPIHLKNAYVTVVKYPAQAPRMFSTVGIDVLKKLSSFAYTRSGLVHSVDLKGAECGRLRIHVYGGGAWRAWGVMVPLHTSFGDGRYFLDTGFDSDYPGDSLVLFSPYANYLVHSGMLKDKDMLRLNRNGVSSSVNGSRALDGTFYRFGFHDDGKYARFLAWVAPRGFDDGNPYYYGSYGVMGRNTVRNAGLMVYMDFRKSRVCVGHDGER